jgi:hypothetical protein
VTAIRKLDPKPEPPEGHLAKQIALNCGDVFLRTDFDDMGGYDQVGRALRGMVRKGQLLKLSSGIYARAAKSPFAGKLVPQKAWKP